MTAAGGTSYGKGYDQARDDFQRDRNAFNARIVAEFRANGGEVPSAFPGVPLLVLHTVGAKSGIPRVNPVVYLPVDDRYVVFASVGGEPRNPSWYYNIVANREITIEVGTETIPVTARIVEDEAERARYWAAMNAARPTLDEYQAKTTRQIPVVVLESRTS
jgi:deazaflavin-dependent oxidoreductase (nitroreductase family)